MDTVSPEPHNQISSLAAICSKVWLYGMSRSMVLVYSIIFFTGIAGITKIQAQGTGSRETTSTDIAWVVDGKKRSMPRSLRFGRIDPDTMNTKRYRKRIIEWYYKNGYLSAEIDTFNITRKSDRLTGRVEVNRGCRFKIDQLNWTGDTMEVLESFTPVLKQGQPYTKTALEREIERVITHYERHGYPLVEVNVVDLERDIPECRLNLTLEIESGRRLRVQGILLPDLKRNDPNYIKRATGIRDSALITPSQLREARRNLQNTGLFEKVSKPEIVVSNSKSYVQIKVEEQNPNLFDLVLGYNPGTDGRGNFVGDGNLKIRNLFWSGSTMKLGFERLERLVTKLNIELSRNWIFGVPLSAGTRFHFIQQDSSYQTRQMLLHSTYTFKGTTGLTGRVGQKTTAANNSLQRLPDALDATTWIAGVGIDYENLDNPLLPTNGMEVSIGLESEIKNITDQRAETDSILNRVLQKELSVDYRQYIPTFNRQVLRISLHGRFIDSDQHTKSDLTRFGGAGSLRGYREDQFRASRLVWGDLEYRYLIDPSTYAFVFGATGWYHRPRLITERTNRFETREWLRSWGLGFTYRTGLGILRVSYAVSPRDALSNGKVHFGLVTDF